MQQKIIPVILSGGAGTRLWPASRSERPKQFLPLLDGKSLFEQTLERVSSSTRFGRPIIVTGEPYSALVAAELQRRGMAADVLLEPEGRDTAVAVAAAAAHANAGDVLLLLAADHYINDVNAFVATVMAGLPAALSGSIVTFGIVPVRPATEFGYIRPGAEVMPEINAVARFIEKPSAEVARNLIAEGCLWNSGNFLAQSFILTEELTQFEPQIAASARQAVEQARIEQLGDVRCFHLDENAFLAVQKKSIDYAVMEKTSKAVVTAAKYGWSDLGSWQSLWEIAQKDAESNASSGQVALLDTTSSFVWSDGPQVAVIGMNDVVVVAAGGKVLVAPKNIGNDIKKLLAAMSSKNGTKA